MILKKINFWYINSFLVSALVALPIITVFLGFFETTSDYFSLLKNTFLLKYIFNSISLLIGVLLLTFILGVGAAYCVSFYNFPGINFLQFPLIFMLIHLQLFLKIMELFFQFLRIFSDLMSTILLYQRWTVYLVQYYLSLFHYLVTYMF